MKKLSLIVALSLLWCVAAFAIEKSQTIVVINGAKFYIHTVQAGETLYSLSKVYGVGERILVEYNPLATGGIKVDERLKIPFIAETLDKPSERKLRKSFDMHFVTKGETLYAISRRYSIPIQTIIEDNPNLDPIHLRPDERILIRRTERGTEPVAEVQAQWEEYKDNLNHAAEAGTTYHLVHAGETFYSIARRFGLTESELSSMNNGLRPADLKAGAIIKIAASGTSLPGEAESAATESIASVAEPEQKRCTEFTPLTRTETLNVALLLPLAVDEKANANYLEFYQGFLLGLDSVKHRGYSINIDLYNTGRNSERTQQIIESPEFGKVNLIVGPVYEDTLEPVIRFAEQKGIPVVSPLANITQHNSDVLFQLSPAPERKYDKIANLFDGSRILTLIYTNNTDKEFEAEVLELLNGKAYTKRQFRYDVSSRGKAGSSNDLTPLLHNNDDNVFIIMSDDEVDVDRILAAIASANTNIVARGYTAPKFVLLGNARWNRYNNIDRTMFFKNRVILLSTYHAKRDAGAVRHFDSSYIRAFGSLPSLYSYRGYDSAMLFCPAMYDDIQYNMEGENYTPLQTTYVFDQKEEGGNHVNRNWTRVNYNSDFTISIE